MEFEEEFEALDLNTTQTKHKEQRLNLGLDFSLDLVELDILEAPQETETLEELKAPEYKNFDAKKEEVQFIQPIKTTPMTEPESIQPRRIKNELTWSNEKVISSGFNLSERVIPEKVLLNPKYFSLSVIGFDLLACVFAASVMGLVFLWATELSFSQFLISFINKSTVQFSTALMLITFFQVYSIVSRGFWGSTLGEWTFDYQLGNNEQINRATYIFKVLWRNFCIVCTGIVTIPLLSLIFKKDIASKLCGLKLYHRG